jgi:plasmid replication initiation protein
LHKITGAILVAFNAAHQAAATMSVAVRAKLVDLHVKSLAAMVKRADRRVGRFAQLAAYHRVQAHSAQHLSGLAWHEANRLAQVAKAEAAKHGVDKQF